MTAKIIDLAEYRRAKQARDLLDEIHQLGSQPMIIPLAHVPSLVEEWVKANDQFWDAQAQRGFITFDNKKEDDDA